MKSKLTILPLALILSLPAYSQGDQKTNSVNPELDRHIEQIKKTQAKQKTTPVKEDELGDVGGFVKHLPKDNELFFNMQGGNQMLESMRGSEIGKFLEKLAAKEGENMDEMMKTPEFQEFLKVAGEEVFISMGDGSGKSLKAAGDMYSLYYRYYYYMLGKILLDTAEEGEMMNNPAQLFSGMYDSVFEDLMKMDAMQMPSIYVGFKVTNKEDRAKYVKVIQDAFAKLPELVEIVPTLKGLLVPDSADVSGEFKGVKTEYKKFSDEIMKTPEVLEGMKMMGLSEEKMKKMSEKFKDFKMTLLAGSHGDYVVIYLGDSSAGLKFAAQPSESLLANAEMQFLKEYKGKEVVSVAYVSKEISENLAKVSGFMQDLSLGVTKFLKEAKSLGNTDQIQALLKNLSDKEGELKALSKPGRGAMVAYLEDGFKMEAFHGEESLAYDLDTKRKLAGIAMQKDAVLSSSYVANEVASKVTVAFLEDIVNLAYQSAKVAVSFDVDDRDFLEFSDAFKMLDGLVSDDLVKIWEAVKTGAQQGLGNESAMVVDLKGKMPRVPGVPSIILDHAKIPRLAIGYDVKDRKVLSSSWDKLDVSTKEVATKAGQMWGQEINYGKPELAKKEGIDLWSYQLGVTSHEANVALGINQNMMFFTTSPAFVESFVPMHDAAGKEGGMDIKLRFAPVREYVLDWVELAENHGEEFSPSFDAEEFKEDKLMINEVLKVSEEIVSIDFSMRKVNGEVRSFFHFNKRN